MIAAIKQALALPFPLFLLSLGKQTLQGPTGFSWRKIAEVIVMRRDVDQPVSLDVGTSPDVVTRGQHKFLVQHPAQASSQA